MKPINLDTSPDQRQKIYNTYLQNISGVSFTIREMDVISFLLLHYGSEKSIASLLSISHRTIGSHIRNITGKLGVNTKASIIKIINKSNKMQYVRDYYFHLVIQALFERQLQNISSTINRSGITLSINCNEITDDKEEILKLLIQHLKLANITLVTTDICKDAIYKENIRLNIDTASIKSLQTKKKLNNTIILLFNKKFDLPASPNVELVSFQETKHYYHSVFKLLTLLIGKNESTRILQDFKKDYQHILDSLNGNKVSEILEAQPKEEYINNKLFYIFILSILSIIFAYFLFQKLPATPNLTNKTNIFQAPIIHQTKSWNLPQQFEHYTMRSEFTDELWSKLATDSDPAKRKALNIVGLHGLGGVGKTTLAKDVILNPRQEYAFKGWFSSESKELLQSEYIELGEKENLFNENTSPKQKIILTKEWLEQQSKILLIYDNAPDMDVLEEYLPQKGDILITSRNHNLPGAIEMDVMSEEESLLLLDALMPKSVKTLKSYKQDLKKLSRMLSYLPLALSQAVAYISEHSLTIAEYITLYSSEKNILLSVNTMPAMDKHQPAYISWDMSIKKLEESAGGDEALKILDVIACCYSEHIPKNLLAQYLYGVADHAAIIKLNEILSLLKKHSLIKTSANTISVHRLVHAWCDSKIHKNKKLELLKKISLSFETLYPQSKNITHDIPSIKTSLSHVKAILLQMQLLGIKENEYVNLMSTLGNIYYALGDYIEGKTWIDKVLTINKKHYGDQSLNTAHALHCLAQIYIKLGSYDEAEKLLIDSLSIKKLHSNAENTKISETLHILGWCHLRNGRYIKAQILLEQALEGKIKYYGTEHIETALVLHTLGRVYTQLGDYLKAKKLLEKALEIKTKHYGIEHIETAYSMHRLGRVYLKLSDFGKARELLELALKIKEERYGNEHIEVFFPLQHLALIDYYLGNFLKSKELISRSLDIVNKNYGKNHQDVAYSLHLLGMIHLNLKNYTEAEIFLNEALRINQKYYGYKSIFVANNLSNLAVYYFVLKDHKKSEEMFKESLSILTAIKGYDARLKIGILNNLGNLYRVIGKYDKSTELLDKAEHEWTLVNGTKLGKALGNRGLLHRDLGNLTLAKEYLEKALSFFQKQFGSDHYYIKETISHLDQIKISIEHSQKSLSYNPENYKKHHNKALGYILEILP